MILLTTIRACVAVGSGPLPAPAPHTFHFREKTRLLAAPRRALKMAHSGSALDALPPAQQRAFEAYLCGTIFTGAENTRRGRSGNRRGPGGESRNVPSRPREEDSGGELRPRPRGLRLPAAAGGAAARGPPARAEPGRGDPPPPQARRCPHARAVAASAAPAPCPASAAAAGGPQNPGRIWRGRGRAAAEVGAARDGGKSRRSGVGSKVCGAGRLFSRIAHVACGRGAGELDPGEIPCRASKRACPVRAQPVLKLVARS